MKKLVILFLAVVLLLGTVGCTGQTPDPSSDGSGTDSSTPPTDSVETVDVFPGGAVDVPNERTPIAGSLYTPSKPESVAGGEELLGKYWILGFETCMTAYDLNRPVRTSFEDAEEELSAELIVRFFELAVDRLHGQTGYAKWYDASTEIYRIPVDEIKAVTEVYLGFDCSEKLRQLPAYDPNATLGSIPLYDSASGCVVRKIMGGFGGDGLFPTVSEVKTVGATITVTVDYWNAQYTDCVSRIYVVEDKGETFTFLSVRDKNSEVTEETYEIAQQSDGAYRIRFFDGNGTHLKTIGSIAHAPTVVRVGDGEYFIRYQPQAGSALNCGYFYNVKTGEFSKEYTGVLCVGNDYVAYTSQWVAAVFIHNRKSGRAYETQFYTEIDSSSVRFLQAELIQGETALLLEYQPAKQQDTVTEFFKLPGLGK